MGETPNLILWGVGTSRTVRPHWAMHELGLAYETRPIGPRTGETKTAEYTALNPRQKVPLLQDGDFYIGESAAIVAYLSRTYSTPECALIPEAQRDYDFAKAIWPQLTQRTAEMCADRASASDVRGSPYSQWTALSACASSLYSLQPLPPQVFTK